MPRNELTYEVDTVDVCGDSVEGHACKRCQQPVEPPRLGLQARCLNPDCLKLGQLRAGGLGKRAKRFRFTYVDFAEAAGCSEEALRQQVFRGKLDLNKFSSAVAFLRKRWRREWEKEQKR